MFSKKIYSALIIILTVFFSVALGISVHADTPAQNAAIAQTQNIWLLGQVIKVADSGAKFDDLSGKEIPYQTLSVKILGGKEDGKVVSIDYGGDNALQAIQSLHDGDKVVLTESVDDKNTAFYSIVDHYRLPEIYIIIALFFGLVILFGRLRGFSSIISLIVTVILLIKWILPHILTGNNPFAVSLTGAVIIVLVSLYLAHGFNKRTSIAVVSSLIVLALAVGLAFGFTGFTHLSGGGTEEALTLRVGEYPNLNLVGLLLGGMIIGVLGVLDDITTGQSSAVEEIHHANPKLPFKELYKRAFSIGREHIASLVNTLVLAYAGASLPLLLLLVSTTQQPFWVLVNSEQIVEEIVRTLVGSVALVLAVPITTLIAAYFFSRQVLPENASPESQEEFSPTSKSLVQPRKRKPLLK